MPVENFQADFIIKKKYISKKNNVYLLQSKTTNAKYIFKKYTRLESLKREKEILSLLETKRCSVPRIIDFGKNYILMDFIQGETLLDIFEKWEISNQPVDNIAFFLQQFSNSLKGFYKVLLDTTGRKHILNDTNLRNFLWTKDAVYLLDFEEVGEGPIEKDIAQMCAYLLTYNPTFTFWKKIMVQKLLNHFASELSLNFSQLSKKLQQELQIIGVRRNLLIPESIKIFNFI